MNEKHSKILTGRRTYLHIWSDRLDSKFTPACYSELPRLRSCVVAAALSKDHDTPPRDIRVNLEVAIDTMLAVVDQGREGY